MNAGIHLLFLLIIDEGDEGGSNQLTAPAKKTVMPTIHDPSSHCLGKGHLSDRLVEKQENEVGCGGVPRFACVWTGKQGPISYFLIHCRVLFKN